MIVFPRYRHSEAHAQVLEAERARLIEQHGLQDEDDDFNIDLQVALLTPIADGVYSGNRCPEYGCEEIDYRKGGRVDGTTTPPFLQDGCYLPKRLSVSD